MMRKKLPKQIDVKDNIHGHIIRDPFRWLEDPEEKEVKDWIEEENLLARKYLDSLSFRYNISKRLLEVYSRPSYFMLQPAKRSNRYFYMKRISGIPQPYLMYKDGIDGKERVAFDINQYDKDGALSIDYYAPSPDGKLVVLGVSNAGKEDYMGWLVDVKGGDILANDINMGPHTRGIYWKRDGKGFYHAVYSANNNKGIGKRDVFFYNLESNHDELIVKISDEGWVYMIESEDSNDLIIVLFPSTNFSYVYHMKLSERSALKMIAGDDRSLYIPIGIDHEHVYIFTNFKAQNRKVIKFDLNDYKSSEVVNERNIPLEMAIYMENRKALALHYIKEVSSTLVIKTLDGREHTINNLPLGNVISIGEDAKGNLALEFTSYLEPSNLYIYEVDNNRLKVLAKTPSMLDGKHYEFTRFICKSKDGTEVPFTIIHKKDIKRDGKNPCILTGYGGFNISMLPRFPWNYVPFIESGGILAIANLRGGGEFGEEWHRSGMREKKQNVFDDFISIAEFLINQGYTSSERLAIAGGSNGGLLVSAVMVQRPELFKAVVCMVPLTDMVRFHKLLLGSGWVEEYGNPEDPKDFSYLIKYSPYHNVKEGIRYPSILIMTSEYDTRVHPCHAWKFAAKLIVNSPNSKVLLLTKKKEGHGIGKPTSKIVEDWADVLAFIYDELNIGEQALHH